MIRRARSSFRIIFFKIFYCWHHIKNGLFSTIILNYNCTFLCIRWDQSQVDCLRNVQYYFLLIQLCVYFLWGLSRKKKPPLTCFFIISYLTYHLETTSSSTTIRSDRLQSDFTVSWSIGVCTPSLVSFCLFWRFPRLNKTVYNSERQLTELFSFVISFQNPLMPRNLHNNFLLKLWKRFNTNKVEVSLYTTYLYAMLCVHMCVLLIGDNSSSNFTILTFLKLCQPCFCNDYINEKNKKVVKVKSDFHMW